jgi:pentatricopeptide repeat protein
MLRKPSAKHATPPTASASNTYVSRALNMAPKSLHGNIPRYLAKDQAHLPSKKSERSNALENVINQIKALPIPTPRQLRENKKTYISYSREFRSITNLSGCIAILERMTSARLYPNAFILNQCISELSRFHRYPDAIQFYQLAIQSNQADNVTFNSVIYASGKNGPFTAAQAAFDEAKKLRIADVVTFNSFIDAAGKNGQFTAAQAAFDEAKNLRIANVKTFTSFIDAAGKNGHFAAAQAAFYEAKNLRIANVVTFNSFIHAAGKNGHFAAAQAAFYEAKNLRIANVMTFTSFIDAAGKNGHFAAAQAAFDEAKNLRIANVMTFTSFIDAAGKNGQFAAAQAAFDEAKNLRIADVVTFTSFIDAAGKNGQFTAAQAAFDEAKNLRDVVTFTSFIDAAGKNGHFAAAQAAFDEAKNLRIANVVTFNSFIDAAGRNGALDTALKVFHEMKSKDPITYHSMLTAFVFANELSTAEKFYQQNKIDIPIKETSKGTFQINLHDQSYGSTFIGLKLFLLNLPLSQENLISLTLIIGQGIHNAAVDLDAKGHHPIKQAVMQLSNQYQDAIAIKEDKQNAGRLLMKVNQQALKDAASKSNPDTRPCDFPDPYIQTEDQFDEYMRSISADYDDSAEEKAWKRLYQHINDPFDPTVREFRSQTLRLLHHTNKAKKMDSNFADGKADVSKESQPFRP